jgi:hypothetical protein
MKCIELKRKNIPVNQTGHRPPARVKRKRQEPKQRKRPS